MSKLALPERSKKPRSVGITSVSDVGLSMDGVRGILRDFGDMIDVVKFGVGSAYVAPRLGEKIALYKQHQVRVYFGGTLFEKFYAAQCVDSYISFLEANNIDTIEISTGVLDIPIAHRAELVRRLSGKFEIFAEVGSKDKDRIMPPSEWISEINTLLIAGCRYIVAEGRDSATAGLYRPSGEMRMGLLHDILKNCDASRIIFEAPMPAGRMFLINTVGTNVNLGNISPEDVLLVESERVGLRYETFSIK